MRSNKSKFSISFSIAYVRVCEWAENPNQHLRPKMDELRLAKDHATRLQDDHILQKIQDCFDYYREVEKTPTPALPAATPVANEIAVREVHKPKQVTLPYSITTLTRAERLDLELDQLISKF